MIAEASDAQHARFRGIAADLRGVDRFDWLVRISIAYAHADSETRDAKLNEMSPFVRAVAEAVSRENGVVLKEAELAAVAGAVALDARTALVLMPEGGRA